MRLMTPRVGNAAIRFTARLDEVASSTIMRLPAEASSLEGPLEILLGSLTAMATGAVAGSVSLAMVLGHWYLTIPTLDVAHLRRLNRVTTISMLACLVLLAVTCVAFQPRERRAATA